LYSRFVSIENTIQLSKPDFRNFLAKNALFRLMDGLPLDPSMQSQFEEAGMDLGECVMLETRMPTDLQMAETMIAQLAILEEASASAMIEARERQDNAHAHKVQKSLERLADIRKRMAGFMVPSEMLERNQ